MTSHHRRAGRVVVLALLISVATQIVYMIALGGPSPEEPGAAVTHADRARYFTERWPEIAAVWTVELAAFTTLAVAALVALSRSTATPTAWAALAVAGLFNVLQVGIGLSMFRPAVTAGDALEPLFTTVLGGAFFLYFLAKALVGLAGAGFGLRLIRQPDALARVVGGLAMLVGLIAAGINIAALPTARALTVPAGASGTAAALTTAMAVWLMARRSPHRAPPKALDTPSTAR